jgi:hypothetical protein
MATFIKDCEPRCDGSFCGDDSCGGACGVCGDSDSCNGLDGRCYLANCQPQCAERECGEDGCGGTCGTCSNDLFCLGASIATEEDDEATPTSTCTAFPECGHFLPTCDGCTNSQLCGSDCLCYDSPEELPDLVVVESDLLEEMHLHDAFSSDELCSSGKVRKRARTPSAPPLVHFHCPEPRTRGS